MPYYYTLVSLFLLFCHQYLHIRLNVYSSLLFKFFFIIAGLFFLYIVCMDINHKVVVAKRKEKILYDLRRAGKVDQYDPETFETESFEEYEKRLLKTKEVQKLVEEMEKKIEEEEHIEFIYGPICRILFFVSAVLIFF
jgi:hypothetical protein